MENLWNHPHKWFFINLFRNFLFLSFWIKNEIFKNEGILFELCVGTDLQLLLGERLLGHGLAGWGRLRAARPQPRTPQMAAGAKLPLKNLSECTPRCDFKRNKMEILLWAICFVFCWARSRCGRKILCAHRERNHTMSAEITRKGRRSGSSCYPTTLLQKNDTTSVFAVCFRFWKLIFH